MSKLLFNIVSPCLLLVVLGLSVLAQSSTATLSGTVEDERGAVIPGANVTIVNTGTGARRNTTTNDNGLFTVPLLPPSTYTVTVEHTGFGTVQFPDVVLNVGEQKAIQVALKVGDVNAAIEVRTDAVLLDTDGSVGTVIDRQFVANIPLNGRSFQSLITLTPGVVVVPESRANFSGQFSVNGQRSSANSFTVDGVSANVGTEAQTGFALGPSGSLPGLTALGTTQSLASVDAMQEFKVQTSTYAAEYGRQPGGQVSIATRSGANQFHGSAFDYLRNDVFDANNWFANRAGLARSAERQNDFGGTFSGPILLPRFGEGGKQPGYNGRNRTFFFFSYEGLRLQLPRFSLTNVPTLALRQSAPPGLRPILNGFPLPNGRDLGNGLAELNAGYSDSSRLDAGSIRIDHRLTSKIMLFGRYNKVPSQTSTRGAGGNLAMGNKVRIDTQTVTVGLTASVTPRLSQELRLNFSNNSSIFGGTPDSFGGAVPPVRSSLIPAQYDSPTAVGQVLLLFPGTTSSDVPQIGFIGPSWQGNQRQFNIVDSFSYSAGAHQLKVGVDYRRLTPLIANQSYLLVANFFSQSAVLNSAADLGILGAQLPATPVFVNLSAYGQDTWQVGRRLTINLGLRWEVNPAPTAASGPAPAAVTQIDSLSTMQLAPPGTKLWRTTYGNFAPRLGVAYQIGQKPGRETLVRGGFGVFYDTGNEQGTKHFFADLFQALQLLPIVFPLVPARVAPPAIPTVLSPPYGLNVALTISNPRLKLPYTLQWNIAAEQSLGRNQALTVSYVGAAGSRLLQQTRFSLRQINPSFANVNLIRNSASSDYNALQAQFQRRLSQGLQALVSYTWSHALDDDSSSLSLRVAQRGNADFDVRHNFAAAVTYDLPRPRGSAFARAVLGHWSIDSSVRARSGVPVDLVARTLVDPVDGSFINVRPNVIAGVPLYLSGSQYPGGRSVNNTVPTAAQIAAAGCNPTGAAKGRFCTPPAGQSGNLGRNQVRGFGAWQVDAALRREFKLGEQLKLQFRAEAFNVFNHPNFGAIQTNLGAANFGQATNMLNQQLTGLSPLYQIGGPRSLQFALKFLF